MAEQESEEQQTMLTVHQELQQMIEYHRKEMERWQKLLQSLPDGVGELSAYDTAAILRLSAKK